MREKRLLKVATSSLLAHYLDVMPSIQLVPTVEWEEREIVVSEGENRLVCFSADIGTILPYQVLVGVRGKEERSASGN